jgi:hypothetical protein
MCESFSGHVIAPMFKASKSLIQIDNELTLFKNTVGVDLPSATWMGSHKKRSRFQKARNRHSHIMT